MSDLKLDKNEWRLFLKALNKKKDTVRLRAFFPKGHFLKDSDRGKKSHADLDWITQCQTEGRGVYIVVNDGGDTDSSITHCKAFFCEWDDREKIEQIDLDEKEKKEFMHSIDAVKALWEAASKIDPDLSK